MENYLSSQTDNTGEEMKVTSEGRAFLKEAAKWAKFLSILGFIGIGLMIMVGFIMGAFMSTSYGSAMADSGLPAWFFPIFYIVFAAIYIVPIYYLYQFSNKVKIALESNDTALLNEALSFLKSHYKYIGIMSIVSMAIYGLAIIIAIIVGIVGATAFASI